MNKTLDLWALLMVILLVLTYIMAAQYVLVRLV